MCGQNPPMPPFPQEIAGLFLRENSGEKNPLAVRPHFVGGVAMGWVPVDFHKTMCSFEFAH